MILCSFPVCPLMEDNTTVGLHFMWLTTQHVLTQAAGFIALIFWSPSAAAITERVKDFSRSRAFTWQGYSPQLVFIC